MDAFDAVNALSKGATFDSIKDRLDMDLTSRYERDKWFHVAHGAYIMSMSPEAKQLADYVYEMSMQVVTA